jgi:hypothetical protein
MSGKIETEGDRYMKIAETEPSHGVRKHWFSWVFRGSACLHLVSVLLILFVLLQMAGRPWLSRSVYFMENEKWIMIAWVSTFLAVLSFLVNYTILLFALNHRFRLILQWAWLIQLIGGAVFLLYHLVQMFLFPLMVRLFLQMPTLKLVQHLDQWDQLLTQMVSVFGPTCWAIGGLIYTAVMFRTRDFSPVLSWWSLIVWTVVLTGAVIFRWVGSDVSFLQGFAIFMYIPWLWNMGEQVKPRFSN